MKKGAKKPWTKVGKLERRIEALEKLVEQKSKHYNMDFEEITTKFQRETKDIRENLESIRLALILISQQNQQALNGLLQRLGLEPER